jgi:hypothetical protein
MIDPQQQAEALGVSRVYYKARPISEDQWLMRQIDELHPTRTRYQPACSQHTPVLKGENQFVNR